LTVAAAILLVAAAAGQATPAVAWPTCPIPSGLPEAAARGDLRDKVWLKICGPHEVVRGRNYKFTIVVQNISTVTFREFEMWIYHYDPITRSTRPYRRGAGGYGGMTAAILPLKSLKPRAIRGVSIMLPFKEHNDPIGSNVTIELRAAKWSTGGTTHDVFFIR